MLSKFSSVLMFSETCTKLQSGWTSGLFRQRREEKNSYLNLSNGVSLLWLTSTFSERHDKFTGSRSGLWKRCWVILSAWVCCSTAVFIYREVYNYVSVHQPVFRIFVSHIKISDHCLTMWTQACVSIRVLTSSNIKTVKTSCYGRRLSECYLFEFHCNIKHAENL